MGGEETTMQTQNKDGSTESNRSTRRKMPTDIPIADMPIPDAEEEAVGDTRVQGNYTNHQPGSIDQEIGKC